MSQIKFTRMHYQFIADILRETLERNLLKNTQSVVGQLSARFADEFIGTNDRFDREKFLRACDPNGGYKNKPKMGG